MSFLRRLAAATGGLALVAVTFGSYAPAATADSRTVLDRATVSVTVTWTQYDSATGDTFEADVQGTGTFVSSDNMLTSSTLFDPESWQVRDHLDEAWRDYNGGSSSKSRREAEKSGELDQPVIEAVANSDGSIEYGIKLTSAQYPDGVTYDHIDMLSPDFTKAGGQLDAEYAKARKSHLAALKVNGVNAKRYLKMVTGDTAKTGSTVQGYYYGASGTTRGDKSFRVYGSAGSGLLDLGNTSSLPYTAAGGPIMSADDNLVGILVETASDARTIYGLSSKALESYLYGINITPEPADGSGSNPGSTTKPTATSRPTEPSSSATPTGRGLPSPSDEPSTETYRPTSSPTSGTGSSTEEPTVQQPSKFWTVAGDIWHIFWYAPLKAKALMLLGLALIVLLALRGIQAVIEKIRGKKPEPGEETLEDAPDSAPADVDADAETTVIEPTHEVDDEALVDTRPNPVVGKDGHPVNPESVDGDVDTDKD